MRRLFDDFMSQSWAMEIIIAWGWLSVVIMAASFGLTTSWILQKQSLLHLMRKGSVVTPTTAILPWKVMFPPDE